MLGMQPPFSPLQSIAHQCTTCIYAHIQTAANSLQRSVGTVCCLKTVVSLVTVQTMYGVLN